MTLPPIPAAILRLAPSMATTRTTTAPIKAGPVEAAPPVASVLPASKPFGISDTAAAARKLATSPPVDTAKVATVREGIANCGYTIDPGRIAAKMIALDLP